MSHIVVSTLLVIVFRLKDVVNDEIGLFVFDVLGVGVRGGKLVGELADTLVDVGDRSDAHNTRVSGGKERLHHNHVVRN